MLSIGFALTCVGFPVAVVLGIVALVKQGKAKRLARESPETYRMPPAGAMVTGLVGLALAVVSIPTVGIAAAIAIPAVLKQHERAQNKAVQQNLQNVRVQAEQLVAETGATSAEELAQALLGHPSMAELKNPYDATVPALEQAEIPGRNGTIALWPAKEAGEDGAIAIKLLLKVNIRENGEVTELSEEVVLAYEAPPAAPLPEGAEAAPDAVILP
jgi:type II secretory pathway pseudopilin PulG